MNQELLKKLHEAGYPNLAIHRHDYGFSETDCVDNCWTETYKCKNCGIVNVVNRDNFSSTTLTEKFYDGCPKISKYREPSLSEMINECGEYIESLVRFDYELDLGIMWRAYPTESAYNQIEGECVVDCCGYEVGDTPEEAIANLYIEVVSKLKTK